MFKLIKIEGARINVPEPEYLEAASELSAGTAVALTDGKLVANATAPTHITLCAAKAAGAKIACARIESNQVYETEISAAPTGLNVGDKVTVSADASSVTAEKTGGIATIVSLEGASSEGDIVIVRF